MRFFSRKMKVAKTMMVPFIFFVLFNLVVFGPGGSIPIHHDWSQDELPALEAIVAAAKSLGWRVNRTAIRKWENRSFFARKCQG